MSVSPPDAYGEVHRTILTHVRACKVIGRVQLEADLQQIVAAVSQTTDSGDDSDQAKIDDFISTINSRITNHGMKITQSRSQVTNETYFLFVNTLSDDIIKTNSTYSVGELDAIKKLIDEIFESGLSYSIGLVPATQVVAATLNKPMREAGVFIEDLVDQGWLNITVHDQVILSMRGLCELERYLLDRYGITEQDGSVYTCFQCKEIVTLGRKCCRCHTAFHYKCGDVWLKSAKLGQCPREGCDFDWNNAAEIIGVDPDSVIAEENVESVL
ncbi:Non-structural maintenance of chromosomes element 1 [Meyerozyma sp. JA9]|nr:Non-structural maintenance of chromosomes element 1 [Meyerozyma sp. JA9]